MDWIQRATQLFQVPRPAHFTNYRHCCECAEHDAILLAYDVQTLSRKQLGNPGWDPLCFVSPEGFLYYMPALIRLTLETMETPQERYLDQLLCALPVTALDIVPIIRYTRSLHCVRICCLCG